MLLELIVLSLCVIYLIILHQLMWSSISRVKWKSHLHFQALLVKIKEYKWRGCRIIMAISHHSSGWRIISTILKKRINLTWFTKGWSRRKFIRSHSLWTKTKDCTSMSMRFLMIRTRNLCIAFWGWTIRTKLRRMSDWDPSGLKKRSCFMENLSQQVHKSHWLA